MIQVNDVLGWVTGKLDISRMATQFSIDTFLRDVDDGVVILARKYPNLRKIDEFTTTAQSGLFKLDVDVRPLKILDIFHQWKYPIKRLQTQQMREYRHLLASNFVCHPYMDYTDQPTYWTYFPSVNSGDLGDVESPGAWVRFENAGRIAAGMTVTIEYSYIPRILRVSSLGFTIDMGEEYKLALCAYVAWQQSVRYAREIGPEKTKEVKELYLMELQQLQIDHRKSLQSNEVEFTEILRF
jgi:hypothetical protein